MARGMGRIRFVRGYGGMEGEIVKAEEGGWEWKRMEIQIPFFFFRTAGFSFSLSFFLFKFFSRCYFPSFFLLVSHHSFPSIHPNSIYRIPSKTLQIFQFLLFIVLKSEILAN